jgi:hypothetical protein
MLTRPRRHTNNLTINNNYINALQIYKKNALNIFVLFNINYIYACNWVYTHLILNK